MNNSGKKDKIDFNFRYRPNEDSPDGILMRYLNSFPPTERKSMILKALRAFYLVAAYGDLGNLEKPSDLEELARSLQETYGPDYDDSHKIGVDIELRIGLTDYFGFSPCGRTSEDTK